ncbi:MAG: N(4)-(beta-N-acetylglucosaminyl)-L-asparaginase [Bacteroidetes bacterium]|nr:N(4)-(beta-N-acetylglucosaminyl)-L-asparaginase [Bacteroidota bacterium]
MERRDFLKKSAAAGAALITQPQQVLGQLHDPNPKYRPVVISSANGLAATARAMELIQSGSDALDACIAGVNIVEDDPEDITVGLGGLPNEDGVVELDSCVMHGPTCRGAGVASLQNIKNPSKVAKVIMERTDHVLLVGQGALKFARMHGFEEMNLLTDRSRNEWLKWKENLSKEDDWLPPHTMEDKDIGDLLRGYARTYGTINCNGLDKDGNLSGVTTTSGLFFKIPGRVGDSPILGAGLFVDNAVGAAGSTGRGEANLLNCSSVMIVEYMRQGKSPEQACLLACQRIVDHTKEARLLNDDKKPKFDVKFYAINKRGDFGGAAIWSGMKFALNTGEPASVLKEGAYLFKRN